MQLLLDIMLNRIAPKLDVDVNHTNVDNANVNNESQALSSPLKVR